MTREEAIKRIVVVWESLRDEVCTSEKELTDSRLKMYAALSALGVSDQEIRKVEA